MAEVIGKSISNECWMAGHILEEISVTTKQDPNHFINRERNYAAIQLAAQTLLKDLAQFEPPIIGASEEDIEVKVQGYEVEATFVRNDQRTTSVPEDYNVDGHSTLSEPRALTGDGIEG